MVDLYKPVWEDVDSTAVNRVGWAEGEQAVYVEFSRGAVYKYHPCSHQEFRDIVEAPSIGRMVSTVMDDKSYEEVSL